MIRIFFVISLLGSGAALSYLIVQFKPLFESALSEIYGTMFFVVLLAFLWTSIVMLLIYVLSRSKSNEEDQAHENNS